MRLTHPNDSRIDPNIIQTWQLLTHSDLILSLKTKSDIILQHYHNVWLQLATHSLFFVVWLPPFHSSSCGSCPFISTPYTSMLSASCRELNICWKKSSHQNGILTWHCPVFVAFFNSSYWQNKQLYFCLVYPTNHISKCHLYWCWIENRWLLFLLPHLFWISQPMGEDQQHGKRKYYWLPL